MLLHGQIQPLTRPVPIARWFRELMATPGVLVRFSPESLLPLRAGARYGRLKPDSGSINHYKRRPLSRRFCVYNARVPAHIMLVGAEETLV